MMLVQFIPRSKAAFGFAKSSGNRYTPPRVEKSLVTFFLLAGSLNIQRNVHRALWLRLHPLVLAHVLNHVPRCIGFLQLVSASTSIDLLHDLPTTHDRCV